MESDQGSQGEAAVCHRHEVGGRQASDIVHAAIEATGDKSDTNGFEKYGYLEILDDAAVAFLGPGFGTGPYEMFGAITVDCEACTITDEKDPSRAFPEDEKGA